MPIVLDPKGHPVEVISGGNVNGPWDMTALDGGVVTQLFFANVLNGGVAGAPPDSPVNEGTVVRMTLFTPPVGFGKPLVLGSKVIGSGFAEENDPAALIIGPTGLALDFNDDLLVADTIGNRIARIPNASFRFTSAGTGETVASGLPLNGPLGLTIAPDGDILAVNSLDGNIVDVSEDGTQTFATIAPAGAGSLFGLAVMPGGGGIYFVDDSENQLNLFN